MNDKIDFTFKNELYRKLIHLHSLSIPIVYSFVTKETALWIIIPLTLISILLDVTMYSKNFISRLFLKIFGRIMRPHELENKYTLNGATWLLLSAIFCILIFPKLFVVVSFSVLIISDALAALFGRKFGKHKLFDKSWEGTSAFIISAFIVSLVVGLLISAPWTYYVFALIGAFASGFSEAASSVLKVDDNFAIPVSMSLVFWGGELLCAAYSLPVYMKLLV